MNYHIATGTYTAYYPQDNTPDISRTHGTSYNLYNKTKYLFYQYSSNVTKSWSPVIGLYSDIAATIPYMGENLSTVYAKPSTTTNYTFTATSDCRLYF
ncbi:MAG: hypothetical protein IPJ54_14810 [Saprospiraceae bacterium]|nr:hypothetical protein [Saprospiraceae bacterium]